MAMVAAGCVAVGRQCRHRAWRCERGVREAARRVVNARRFGGDASCEGGRGACVGCGGVRRGGVAGRWRGSDCDDEEGREAGCGHALWRQQRPWCRQWLASASPTCGVLGIRDRLRRISALRHYFAPIRPSVLYTVGQRFFELARMRGGGMRRRTDDGGEAWSFWRSASGATGW